MAKPEWMLTDDEIIEATQVKTFNDDGTLNHGSGNPMYHAEDTVSLPSQWTAEQIVILAGITPEQWNRIYWEYDKRPVLGSDEWKRRKSFDFSQYLSDLLSLAPLKGLSKEEIEELNAR